MESSPKTISPEQIHPSSETPNEPAVSTPMLKQYHIIKKKHQDCILFFRLGDFYEMFYEDAKVVSKELDLVLTGRGKDINGRVPMCGFPHHASENYIARLVKRGYKIAICEQLEDPALAKGIVKRDIIRIITAGTYLDESSTDTRYLLALAPTPKSMGISFIDPASGTIYTNQYPYDIKRITELLAKLAVYECIYPSSQEELIKNIFKQPTLQHKNICLSSYQDWCFNTEMAQKNICEHFGVHNLSGFGIDELPQAQASCGALLEYLKEMNKQPLRHIDRISLYIDEDYVFITPAATRGLELENFIQTLDETLSPLGKRKFHFWFTHPAKDVEIIRERQEAIKLLKRHDLIQKDLKIHLSKITDLEKCLSRISYGYTHVKDLLALRNALVRIPDFINIVRTLKNANDLFEIEDIPELRMLLEQTVNEDVPLSHPDGKIIKAGYHPELDNLRNIQNHGREWLKNFQAQEIKKTGINSLKVGFNKVFGYYIEITRSNLDLVPPDYIRKQTLVNGERFITPGLKEYEEKILTAEDKILKIENEIVRELHQKILDHSENLHRFCQSLATIDCLYALSMLANSYNYCCPDVNNGDVLSIKEGRHPVVEKTTTDTFVPNDTLLDSEDNHLIILTGPNMAGKSTYIRQSALLTIMAQTGSFIPAKSATIGIVDKIFTRIGAHDDISKGQSTFMVEMNETADILNNLTDKSLVILDEIGRGTSTYDGLSLAWALAEHFQNTKARTLFATHFHELTALADKLPGIKNYNVAVKEWKDEVVFLHKIVPGSSDDSYGIYVAKLAGIPEEVIFRAKKILTQLELKNDIKENIRRDFQTEEQLNLFMTHNDPVLEEIVNTIKALDVNNLTPLQALSKMQEMKEKIER
ncbi:MAG: DNA mismatch repair protein MutS [Candidatus Omnitrophica bacterium]|nr:DNA mismatch repair protein MutS [Candidatus Omnitrophota bacterium]